MQKAQQWAGVTYGQGIVKNDDASSSDEEMIEDDDNCFESSYDHHHHHDPDSERLAKRPPTGTSSSFSLSLCILAVVLGLLASRMALDSLSSAALSVWKSVTSI